MPEKTATPKPSLLQRWFGSGDMSPEMQQGVDIARKENPDLGEVKTYGPISRFLLNQAQAYVSPGKSIYLNPDQLAGMSPEDVADTLTHEQTHVKQMRERSPGFFGPIREMYHEAMGSKEPYYQRPDELAAFQAEKDRRARMGRTQTASPSFLTGAYNVPTDKYLPTPKK